MGQYEADGAVEVDARVLRALAYENRVLKPSFNKLKYQIWTNRAIDFEPLLYTLTSCSQKLAS